MRSVLENTLSQIKFAVSQEMVVQFITLTGDSNALHTDESFARRSMYRSTVVHGMLPLYYLALIVFSDKFRNYYFKRISARFMKPVFIGDELAIHWRILDSKMSEGSLEGEFTLQNCLSGVILTDGSFLLAPTDGQSLSQPGQGVPGMLQSPVQEKSLTFDDIRKGEHDGFSFRIASETVKLFFHLLRAGMDESSPPHLEDGNNVVNVLAASLFSTFAGMCIPGREATFLDFSISFDHSLAQDKLYHLTGAVNFKSQSTMTIVEDLRITDQDDGKTCASGKISVQVNKPSIAMPSIGALKSKALDFGLKGKVVLITGASRGIGETMAKMFSLHGSKVVINYYKSKEDARRVAQEIGEAGGEAMAVGADISDRDQVKQMIQEVCKNYRTIDILVNNAVRDAMPIAFMDLLWDDVQRDIDVIVRGAFNCCQEVIPLMVNNGEGKIINMSTVFVDNPPMKQSKYVLAKSAIVGLTRSLAVELASSNIRVNMVSSSIVETDLTKNVPQMYLERMKAETPMKRNATAVDVARAAVFLASSLSSFTTGQKVNVTGGNAPFL